MLLMVWCGAKCGLITVAAASEGTADVLSAW
jgi:hypothetical protein